MSEPTKSVPEVGVADRSTHRAAGEGSGSVSAPAGPDPEMAQRPTRRKFSAKYKLDILRQADACGKDEVGALLRREGLYSSLLTKWRLERDAGALESLSERKRGPRGRSAQQKRE
jgi:transposase